MNRALLIFYLLLLMACHAQRPSLQDTASSPTRPDLVADTLVILRKGGCYGTCPMYALTVLRNGQVTFEPRRFTKRDSLDQANWPVERLLDAVSAVAWEELDDEYMVSIADIPTYHLWAEGRKIRWNSEVPLSIRRLVAVLDGWTVAEGWVDGTNAWKWPDQPGLRETEVIVQLRNAKDVVEILREFAGEEMALQRKLLPDGSIVLLTYNPVLIDPARCLARLQAHASVSQASFNKEVELRD